MRRVRRPRVRLRGVALVTLAASSLAVSARAADVYSDDDKKVTLAVGALLQPSLAVASKAAPDGSSASTDLYLRRVMFITSGRIGEHLRFVVALNDAYAGRPDLNSLFVQDAAVSYEAAPELAVDGGLLVAPFSHATLEGVAYLHGLDTRTLATPIAAGTTRALRDAGAQLRGLLFGERLHYRAGVFEGQRGPGLPANPAPGVTYPPLNETGAPRFTGMARVNLLGSEPNYFLKGIYFPSSPLLSLGVGADYQHHGTRVTGGPNAGAVANYRAQIADAFFELPFSASAEVVGKAYVGRFRQGAGSATTGYGYGGEAGFRYGWFEPIGTFERFTADRDASGARPADNRTVRAGLNVWADRYAANLKAEVAFQRTETQPTGAATATTNGTAAILQTQVFF